MVDFKHNITFYNTIITLTYQSIRWTCPCIWFVFKSTFLNYLNTTTYKLRNIWGDCRSYQFYDLSRITLHAVRSSFLNSSLTIQYGYNRLNLILQIKISYFAKFIIKMYSEKLSWILHLSHKAKILSETQKYFQNTVLNFHLHSRLMHLTFSIEFKYSSWTHLR